MNRTTRTLAVYTEVINRMGMESYIHANALVWQVADVLDLVIVVDEGDPEFLCVTVWMEAGKASISRLELLEICNAANGKLKGTKCMVNEAGDLVIEVENLMAGTDCVPTVEHTLGVMPRALHMMLAGVKRLTTDLRFAAIADHADDQIEGEL